MFSPSLYSSSLRASWSNGRSYYQQRPHGFVSGVNMPILRFNTPNECDPRDILAWARAMVGHRHLRQPTFETPIRNLTGY